VIEKSVEARHMEKRNMENTTLRLLRPSRTATGLALAAALVMAPGDTGWAQFDICGCSGNPNSLGAFDTLNQATWPPGTVGSSFSAGQPRFLTLELPPDGVMVFDSMNLTGYPQWGAITVNFRRNGANTPVTILVKGNVNLGSTSGYSATLSVNGDPGVSSSTNTLGTGGLGGPGGFRGGDGAYQLVNLASDGGAGLGPSGGAGATATPVVAAQPGSFLGVTELLPILGGSGGGGGRSTSTATNCGGGGGGGGGGAILIAVNGTLSFNANSRIEADGGSQGNAANGSCASSGAVGSGGAIRILAQRIEGAGVMSAVSGSGNVTALNGSIRMESADNAFPVSSTTPIATRSLSTGPIVNPFQPSVAITAVNGSAPPNPPQGGYGVIDLTLPAPGNVAVDLSTQGVPSGTGLFVIAKPRVGTGLASTTIPLTNCNQSGACLATANLNLAAGVYTIEARATFITQ
jgi:hypothetical protein